MKKRIGSIAAGVFALALVVGGAASGNEPAVTVTDLSAPFEMFGEEVTQGEAIATHILANVALGMAGTNAVVGPCGFWCPYTCIHGDSCGLCNQGVSVPPKYYRYHGWYVAQPGPGQNENHWHTFVYTIE